MNRTNRRDPKNEPCGTPVEGVGEENDLSNFDIFKDERSDKYE